MRLCFRLVLGSAAAVLAAACATPTTPASPTPTPTTTVAPTAASVVVSVTPNPASPTTAADAVNPDGSCSGTQSKWQNTWTLRETAGVRVVFSSSTAVIDGPDGFSFTQDFSSLGGLTVVGFETRRLATGVLCGSALFGQSAHTAVRTFYGKDALGNDITVHGTLQLLAP